MRFDIDYRLLGDPIDPNPRLLRDLELIEHTARVLGYMKEALKPHMGMQPDVRTLHMMDKALDIRMNYDKSQRIIQDYMIELIDTPNLQLAIVVRVTGSTPAEGLVELWFQGERHV